MTSTHLRVLGPQHPDRAEAEGFVARIYAERFGARLTRFMPELLAFHAGTELRAVVGLRRGHDGPLFVEHYLDEPAEQAIARALGRPVARGDLVEVGGFAALDAGDARRVILAMTRHLHAARLRWVLFAATRQLRNAFDRLHLKTVPLAEARPERLGDAATDWGRYYEAQPTLLFGDVAAGHAFLSRGPDAAPPPVSWLQPRLAQECP